MVIREPDRLESDMMHLHHENERHCRERWIGSVSRPGNGSAWSNKESESPYFYEQGAQMHICRERVLADFRMHCGSAETEMMTALKRDFLDPPPSHTDDLELISTYCQQDMWP